MALDTNTLFTNIGQAVTSGISAYDAITGAKPAPVPTAASPAPAPAAAATSPLKTYLPWIIGGGVVLLVVGFFAFRRK